MTSFMAAKLEFNISLLKLKENIFIFYLFVVCDTEEPMGRFLVYSCLGKGEYEWRVCCLKYNTILDFVCSFPNSNNLP